MGVGLPPAGVTPTKRIKCIVDRIFIEPSLLCRGAQRTSEQVVCSNRLEVKEAHGGAGAQATARLAITGGLRL
jgi:hypothetical protein